MASPSAPTAAPPQHLRLSDPALCLAAHPTTPTVAVGLSSSGLLISRFPPDSASASTTTKATHQLDAPCRATVFLPSSPHLLASTTKPHLLDQTTPTPISAYTLPSQPGEPTPATTTFTALSPHLVLAGDDIGGVHLLDARTSASPVASVLEQGDYISALRCASAHGTDAVLAASGDGTLCCYDLRMGPLPRLKLQYATDSFQDDLLALAVLPDADCAVAGTLSGAINVYSLRILDAENEVDEARLVSRFYGHPECVNAVLPVGEGALALTTSTDGVVRVVDVMQKSLVGVLEYAGEEEYQEGKKAGKRKKRAEPEAWPIEDMVSVPGLGRPAFALLGHDDYIRFCDGALLVDDGEDESKAQDEGEGLDRLQETKGMGRAHQARPAKKKKKKKSKKRETFEMPAESKESGNSFFDGL